MARLLIVDDDKDILRMADRVLTKAGHQVAAVDNALEAIDLLQAEDFDVLISDANMPRYSGFELVQTIRANPKHQNLSVAMLTGLRERKDVEKAVRAGVDDYIVKPLDPLLLVQKVGSLLERRQPSQKPEIRFSSESAMAKAELAFPVQIESVSELGLVILTGLPLQAGHTIDLTSAFFSQLGDKVPPLKVLKVGPSERPGVSRVEVIFLGASESLLQKIRRWIFTHGASHKAVS